MVGISGDDLRRALEYIKSVDTDVNTADSDIKTADGHIQNVDTSVGTVDTDVKSVDTSVGNVDTDVKAVDTDVQQVDTDVKTVTPSGAKVSDSIASANNTAGLTVSLNNAHRSNIDIHYKLGGAGEVYIEESTDNATWREVEHISLAGAGEGVTGHKTGFPYIRARSPTTGIDISLEIGANP